MPATGGNKSTGSTSDNNNNNFILNIGYSHSYVYTYTCIKCVLYVVAVWYRINLHECEYIEATITSAGWRTGRQSGRQRKNSDNNY